MRHARDGGIVWDMLSLSGNGKEEFPPPIFNNNNSNQKKKERKKINFLSVNSLGGN